MGKDELRKELFDLRMQLQLLKMERKEEDERVKVVEDKIQEVRKQIALNVLAEEKEKKNGKRI